MNPQKYRKRPVVIEAMQWDGSVESATAVIDWILSHDGTARYHDAPALRINTLEGTITASPGDYVIRGVQGEFYPCKPDIFAATYERVVDNAVGPGGSGPRGCDCGEEA